MRHADGYQTRYLDQNASPGWHYYGRYTLDTSSYVRLALPGYFSIASGPVVADAEKFQAVSKDAPASMYSN